MKQEKKIKNMCKSDKVLDREVRKDFTREEHLFKDLLLVRKQVILSYKGPEVTASLMYIH